MTSQQIRQSFLDFFKSKEHTLVPSSSLLPDAPNLLFTNAGMNQFVPIFLGQRAPDVSKWPGAIPGLDTRAADTQKCIRAGGKHNDLEDVGLDTYHHTFFEMLGNWSFGDYFKKEAIEWAWELVVTNWKFPPQRLYATVYCPYIEDVSRWQSELADSVELARQKLNRAIVLPSQITTPYPGGEAIKWADLDAAQFWSEHFLRTDLDPMVHIVPGNRKDNFWMMGDTGPCGPCSEIHVDLTPEDRTPEMEKRGATLVNQGDARCIEIWNLVFIQFNALGQEKFSPLPAKHVDTGMGFERVTSIIQGTKGFSDFKNAKISNYETDIFRPIFDAIERLSDKKYGSTLPSEGRSVEGSELIAYARNPQLQIDIAFRVIADHIRTLSFAIADGIKPGNNDRNYVLKRILRRAVRYGRALGFQEPFFYKLVDVVAQTMGDVFPEIRRRKQQVQETIRIEEESFNKTLDRGIELFGQECQRLRVEEMLNTEAKALAIQIGQGAETYPTETKVISGQFAFKLYDEQGFPLDLTELMARECGLDVDKDGFEKLMEEQRARARAAQKKSIIQVADVHLELLKPTRFVGFEGLEIQAKIQQLREGANILATDASPFYAEMGGQVSDSGTIELIDTKTNACVSELKVVGVKYSGNGVILHQFDGETNIDWSREVERDYRVRLHVDATRRNAIQRHHTVTHLLHWALHEVVSKDATQKGSYVGPEKLTFDFSSAPLTPAQVRDVEKLVNERILENAGVSWTEVPYADVKSRKDILQFFGDKYGDVVRVVQIGGQAKALDGYSMELCGGTHTRATGEIGLFRVVGEGAIAAGIRRIEAVAGLQAYEKTKAEAELIAQVATRVNSPVGELEKKIESLLAQQKELEKQLKATQQKQAAETARALLAKARDVSGTRAIIENLGTADGDYLQAVADALKAQFKGVVVLGGVANNAVTLVAAVSSDLTSKVQAGKIIQSIAPIIGGKGGGRPDNARGGGKDVSKLDQALAKAAEMLGT